MSLQKGNIWTQRHAQREDDVKRFGEKTAFHKPRREAGCRPFLRLPPWEITSPANDFLVAFEPPEPGGINVCCVNHLVWGALTLGLSKLTEVHSVYLLPFC